MDLQKEREDVLWLTSYQEAIAGYSEKTLHLEDKRFDLPFSSAISGIIDIAFKRINNLGVEPIEHYIERQIDLEQKSWHHLVGGSRIIFEDLTKIEQNDLTWLHLQAVQAKHDFEYHPDVVLPGKPHHLAHTVLHIAMTNGKLAGSVLRDEPAQSRLDNYVKQIIFSVKSATALNINLPESPVSNPPEIEAKVA